MAEALIRPDGREGLVSQIFERKDLKTNRRANSLGRPYGFGMRALFLLLDGW
ncbi:hypothetical protein [Chthonomonas calidirosea]|uniref:hypothetical protein n=1 Tax=Chthonomonas calidirosea TaxID=454171 RepID=UPI0003A4BAA0|nr:hypothetical protein [Chthonomonas calidirosea]